MFNVGMYVKQNVMLVINFQTKSKNGGIYAIWAVENGHQSLYFLTVNVSTDDTMEY